MSRKLQPSRRARLVRLLPIVLLLGACATGTIREKLLTLPVIDGANYVGTETCAGCHDQLAAEMAASTHGRLAEFELMGSQGGCEACHGAGSLHAESGDPAKILGFARLAPEESAALCVKCHSDGKLFDWTHGEHALSDVGCSDCHTLHGETTARAQLKKSDPELCYDCHREQQAKANFPSHHPIREGKMTCSDCHNPHGELLTEEQDRDLCLTCHARYQGPFIFEHAPVEEGCNLCHDPHGSVANNLLQQSEPFLCLQCHESHFHATRVGGSVPASNVAFSSTNPDGTLAGTPVAGADDPATPEAVPVGGDTPGNVNNGVFVNPADPPATVQITNTLGEHSWQMAFGTKCTVCHSVVHGSDLPSQSSPSVVPESSTTNHAGSGDGQGFPSGGAGLTR